MSVALSTPPSATRSPIAGKLTIAHLRPRLPDAAPVPPSVGERPSRDESDARQTAPSPLKGDKPRRLETARVRPASTAAEILARTASATPNVVTATRKEPAETRPPAVPDENARLLRAFHYAAKQLWPAAFPMRDDRPGQHVPPLAIGAGDEIAERLKGRFAPEQVNLCMRAWTTRASYLRGTIHHHENGMPRVRLDGMPSDDPRDVVSRDHAARARAFLKRGKHKIAKGNPASSDPTGEPKT